MIAKEELNILWSLEQTAEKYEDRVAVSDMNQELTWKELVKKAQVIGAELSEKVQPGNPVPVLLEKSSETLAVMLGIVYAGCFYVLMDTKQPASRLQQILGILDSDVIVTSEKYLKDLEKLEFKGKVLMAPDLATEQENEAVLNEIREQALDVDPLYGIFTSGSTGVPKGVVVGHRSVLDFIDCFTELFDITDKDVMGNQAPWDFDVSVKDIYSGLKTGATVQIIPKQLFSFPMKLIDYLIEREVTTLVWAVSALCIISTLNGFEYKVPDKIKNGG